MRRLACAGLLFCGIGAAQAPMVGLSLNGRAVVTLYRGWPAVAAASFVSPNGGSIPLALRAATLRIGFSTPGGADASGSLRLVPPDADSVTLDGQNAAQALWLLAPEDSSQLPPGQYVLRLTLDTTGAAAPGQWNGTVVAAPVQVEVKDPPASLPDDLDAELALAQSHYRELTDDPDGALGGIASLLERQPDNLPALVRKADLFLTAGRFPEAAQAYTVAIVRFQALFPDATHPPRQLLRSKSEAQWRAAGLDP